jgi:hypothetical protein
VASIEVDYDPISITASSGPVTVDVTGLNDIKLAVTQPITTDATATLKVPDPITTDSTLTLVVPDPIKTDSSLTFTIPEPIRTDSRAEIDLQPIALDQCLRLSLGPLPLTRICLPNRQRIGLTVFGVEVLGLTLDGEAQVLVGEPHRQAHVIGPGEQHFDHDARHGRRNDPGDEAAGDGAFRVRLSG